MVVGPSMVMDSNEMGVGLGPASGGPVLRLGSMVVGCGSCPVSGISVAAMVVEAGSERSERFIGLGVGALLCGSPGAGELVGTVSA